MSRATGILAKINSAMNRFTPLTRTCYKRVITRTGGNDLIGRPASVTIVDTLLSPQPVYLPIGRKAQPGGRDKVGSVLTSVGQSTVDDWEFTVSASAMSLSDLHAKDVVLVLKDSTGAEEVFDIKDFEPVGLQGVTVALVIFARSIKRT